MANKIYIDDVGLEIIIDMKEDISDATTYEMLVWKDGEEVTWASSVYNNNYLRYVTIDGDLDVAGTYHVQGHFVFPGGWSGLSETISFVVHRKWR